MILAVATVILVVATVIPVVTAILIPTYVATMPLCCYNNPNDGYDTSCNDFLGILEESLEGRKTKQETMRKVNFVRAITY